MTTVLLSAALVSTIAIGGSIAFLTTTDTATNKIKLTDDLDTDIDEPDWPEPDKVLPGDTYAKNPMIKSTNDVYARMKISFYEQNADGANGAEITDAGKIAKIKSLLKYDPNYNETGDLIDEDGSYTEAQVDAMPLGMYNSNSFDAKIDAGGVTYYYYMTSAAETDINKKYTLALAEGDDDVTSPALFTDLIVPSDWSNDDVEALGKFNIDVTVEAIQAKNNPLPTDTVTDLDSYHDWFNTALAANS